MVSARPAGVLGTTRLTARIAEACEYASEPQDEADARLGAPDGRVPGHNRSESLDAKCRGGGAAKFTMDFLGPLCHPRRYYYGGP